MRRGADTQLTRAQVVHDHINGRLPFFASGNLYTADDMLKAYQTGWVESVSIGKSIMLNPNLVELIQTGFEAEIQNTLRQPLVVRQLHRLVPSERGNQGNG